MLQMESFNYVENLEMFTMKPLNSEDNVYSNTFP